MPRKIGYALDGEAWPLESQIERLRAAKCDEILIDLRAPGLTHETKSLNDALQRLQPGDTLTVCNMVMLGRTLRENDTVLIDLVNRDIELENLDDPTAFGNIRELILARTDRRASSPQCEPSPRNRTGH